MYQVSCGNLGTSVKFCQFHGDILFVEILIALNIFLVQEFSRLSEDNAKIEDKATCSFGNPKKIK